MRKTRGKGEVKNKDEKESCEVVEATKKTAIYFLHLHLPPPLLYPACVLLFSSVLLLFRSARLVAHRTRRFSADIVVRVVLRRLPRGEKEREIDPGRPEGIA